MTPDQLYAIIGSVVAVGISLALLILRATSRIDRVQSEGAADRRALQASMDAFRTEMQRLAERQSRVEGALAAPQPRTDDHESSSSKEHPMHRYACLTLVLLLALPASVRADICGDHRMAIDSYIAATDAGAAVEEALEAARSGTRAARASRSAIKALTGDTTLEIIEVAGALDALEAADAASTATGEAFEAIYNSVKAATAELAEANTAILEEARIEADEAAEGALDSLSKFKAMTRRTALKAASVAAGTSPGATTSKGLIEVHENIYRAACEE